jgi:branched-chain amino acid transport system permease protein
LDQVFINLLNGLSSGLLLFMLSSGLTLIFSMMGVLNFAHASFYMVGAYVAYSLTGVVGFWAALLLAPLAVGLMGAGFERLALRRVHKFGHVPELLITFGLSYVILELVQLVWGRTAVPFTPPPELQGSAFTIVSHPVEGMSLMFGRAAPEICAAASCSNFPLTKAFMMVVALLMLVALWLLLTRTRVGLVIQASLTHPEMAEALGHNVPRVLMLTFVTEPNMAAFIGAIIFVVVVVGGIGSLAGAFVGSLVVGLLQTLPLTVDGSLASALTAMGFTVTPSTPGYPVLRLALKDVAQILPYLLMVLILIFRPKGLLGTRED